MLNIGRMLGICTMALAAIMVRFDLAAASHAHRYHQLPGTPHNEEKVVMERAKCHDCHALEGEHHELGCDVERCPFCGWQLISCGCCYKLLNIDCSPGTRVYEFGLTHKQEMEWGAYVE